MKPKPSAFQRERWRKYPLTAVGFTLSPYDQERILTCLEANDRAGAQRIILDSLQSQIDGPPFRVQMRPGERKRLVNL